MDRTSKVMLPKAQAKLSLMRKIRLVLNMKHFLDIVSSQVLSSAYYASPAWLNITLRNKEWKKIDSLYYCLMLGAINDFKGSRK